MSGNKGLIGMLSKQGFGRKFKTSSWPCFLPYSSDNTFSMNWTSYFIQAQEDSESVSVVSGENNKRLLEKIGWSVDKLSYKLSGAFVLKTPGKQSSADKKVIQSEKKNERLMERTHLFIPLENRMIYQSGTSEVNKLLSKEKTTHYKFLPDIKPAWYGKKRESIVSPVSLSENFSVSSGTYMTGKSSVLNNYNTSKLSFDDRITRRESITNSTYLSGKQEPGNVRARTNQYHITQNFGDIVIQPATMEMSVQQMKYKIEDVLRQVRNSLY